MRSRLYFFSLVSAFALLLTTRTARGEVPSPSAEEQKRAATLVRQLSDRSYRVRERAAKELLRMGLSAKKAVEEGTKDTDPEVRKRCADLLPDILQAEFRARLEAFRADKDCKKQHDLPGWKLYREIVGTDREAREFFLDVCAQNASLMELLEKDPARAGAAVADRCDQLQMLFRVPNSGRIASLRPVDLAPMFLILSEPRSGVPRQTTYQ